VRKLIKSELSGKIKEIIMKTFANLTEPQIIDKIKELINVVEISGLKKIDKGAVLKGSRFKETIEKYYRGKLLWPLIEADLILIFEDYKEIIDRNLIVAVEIKYFTPKVNTDKQLRQAYREIGQPLRNLIYGFDSTVLWHIFHERIEDEKIKTYTTTVYETIQKLKLPMPYFATKFSEDKFKYYQPWDIDYQNIEYIIRNLQNSCNDTRNPLQKKEIEGHRNAIKVVIGIP
jgi:hypothetical protein